MGGCSSKRTRTGTCDSYNRRRESALNFRAYRTTNPTTLESTINTKNSVSQSRPPIQRQQQCVVGNTENGAEAKQTHEGVETSSEAYKIPIQKKNYNSLIDTAVYLNQSSKFAEANLVKEVSCTSKKPACSKISNFNSFAIPSISNTQHYPQMHAEKKIVANTSHTTETKLNKNAPSHGKAMDFGNNKQTTWDVNRKIVTIENGGAKSKAYDQNKLLSIKNNAASSLKLRKPGKSKYKTPNNHIAKKRTTHKNNRNELYIDRKDMKEFFELLKCPVCYQRIHGPIQKCVVGHFICASCRSKLDRDRCPICQSEMSKERMITLENMIEVFSMRCPYRKFGCRHTVNQIQMQQHIEECSYGVISCVDAKCSWEGKLEHIAFHFARQHSENVFQPSDELSIPSTKQDYTYTYLVRLHYRHNFFCRFKVCNAANALSIAVQCVPTPRFKMEQWSYRLTLFAGVKRTLYSDLKVHEFKNTDSLNLVDKSLILPLNEVEVFEVDGSIKWKIWFTKLDSETAKPAVDGYCDVRNVTAERKTKSEKCEM